MNIDGHMYVYINFHFSGFIPFVDFIRQLSLIFQQRSNLASLYFKFKVESGKFEKETCFINNKTIFAKVDHVVTGAYVYSETNKSHL